MIGNQGGIRTPSMRSSHLELALESRGQDLGSVQRSSTSTSRTFPPMVPARSNFATPTTSRMTKPRASSPPTALKDCLSDLPIVFSLLLVFFLGGGAC